MTRALANAVARALPGAQVSDPSGGGHDARKLGGKMFAGVGAARGDGVDATCAGVEAARQAVGTGHAVKAPCFHASRVRLPWGPVPEEALRERIETSCRLNRDGLPKQVRAALG